jgi:hypothetical protein
VRADFGKNAPIVINPLINRAQITADIYAPIVGILSFQRVIVQSCIKRISQKDFQSLLQAAPLANL